MKNLTSKWKKSSYSVGDGACVEVRLGPDWHKSTYSNPSGSCVAARRNGKAVQVRDTKDQSPDAPVLEFTPQAWAAFLNELKP